MNPSSLCLKRLTKYIYFVSPSDLHGCTDAVESFYKLHATLIKKRPRYYDQTVFSLNDLIRLCKFGKTILVDCSMPLWYSWIHQWMFCSVPWRPQRLLKSKLFPSMCYFGSLKYFLVSQQSSRYLNDWSATNFTVLISRYRAHLLSVEGSIDYAGNSWDSIEVNWFYLFFSYAGNNSSRDFHLPSCDLFSGGCSLYTISSLNLIRIIPWIDQQSSDIPYQIYWIN